ncbi:unnamed protein product [Orchesella dallaii]|uniref:Kazal-like domain-containing protein n=1 Tax=Orchesella dallaii TaxID=48710 RepID=A0ABP1RQA0_9HEXA
MEFSNCNSSKNTKFNKVIVFALLLTVLFCVLLSSQARSDDRVCYCGRLRFPVCGSNGITYDNPCSLICAQRLDKSLRQVRRGGCISHFEIRDDFDDEVTL